MLRACKVGDFVHMETGVCCVEAMQTKNCMIVHLSPGLMS